MAKKKAAKKAAKNKVAEKKSDKKGEKKPVKPKKKAAKPKKKAGKKQAAKPMPRSRSVGEIRAAAYQIYLRRIANGEPGDAEGDWLEAEKG